MARNPNMVSEIVARHKAMLSASCSHDSFLSEIGQRVPSHAFLARSTQGVYLRQIAWLTAILTEYEQAPPESIRILDWGSGKGQTTYLLKSRGFNVTSCDVAAEKADSTFGQEIPIVEAKQIEVVPLHHPSRLPFDDASFDCVVSFGVLEHVPSDVASLLEVRRVLKPGGIFAVTFLPYFLSWTQAADRMRGGTYHDRLYRKRQLRSMAKDAGFAVADVWHGQLFPKGSMPIKFDATLEPLDRFLCRYTPLRYFATNLEAVLVAV